MQGLCGIQSTTDYTLGLKAESPFYRLIRERLALSLSHLTYETTMTIRIFIHSLDPLLSGVAPDYRASY